MRSRCAAWSQCFRAQKLPGTILPRGCFSGERGFAAGSDKQKLKKGKEISGPALPRLWGKRRDIRKLLSTFCGWVGDTEAGSWDGGVLRREWWWQVGGVSWLRRVRATQCRALSILPVPTAVSSSKGAILYEPCVVSTPVLRTEYCPGGAGVLKSSGSCSIVGTGELYIPCEPQGPLGCGSRRGPSTKLGAGGSSSCHKC